MREHYIRALNGLNGELAAMGALIEKAIRAAVDILESRSVFSMAEARVLEEQINRKEKEIETLCEKLILKQQPVAHDLRLVSAALKMITDMERIGDNACDVAGIAGRLADRNRAGQTAGVTQMAHETAGMVAGSIDAFVKKDAAAAKEVIRRDDIVDALFEQAKDELAGLIVKTPEDAGIQIELLLAAKYFERIGDHAVNIAEWVIYSVTGEKKNEIM